MTPTKKHIKQSGAFNHIHENSGSNLYATQHTPLPLQTFASIIPPLHDASSAYGEQCLDTGQLRRQHIEQIQKKLLCLKNDKQIQKMLALQNTNAEAPLQTLGASGSKPKPHCAIAPCPARGMPLDHNFKTAHFLIPDDIKHGDELVCSYFDCQRAGIKFRYCSVCEIPVPKRNFRKIHSHGEDIEKAKRCSPKFLCLDSDSPSVEISGITTQSAISTTQAFDKEGNYFVSPLASPQPSLQNKRACESKRKLKDINMTSRSISKSKKRRRKQKIVDFLPEEFLEEEKRKRRWDELLYKRPPTSDKKAMSKWLSMVLYVSDPKKPKT